MKNCEYCKSPAHNWLDCPKKPVGWRPDRLTKVRIGTPSPDRPVTPKSDVSALPPRKEVHTQSTALLTGKQADPKGVKPVGSIEATRDEFEPHPVDTNAGSSNGRTVAFDAINAGSTPAPAPKFDKKAWMREYMREHRKGIRRRPKPSIQTTTEERNE